MSLVKLTNLRLLYGVAGAREKFEDLSVLLIKTVQPDLQRLRVVRGDGGIDAYVGALGDGDGIDVFQVKYFPDGIDDAQKQQIRDSFATVRSSTKYVARSWTLCLPIDLGIDEQRWFDDWSAKQAGSGIQIEPIWGALQLERLLLDPENRGIREDFFKEEHLELLRAHGATLEKLLAEFVQRVPLPRTPVLEVTISNVRSRRTHLWGDRFVVEVEVCFLVKNVGNVSVPKWNVGCELHGDGLRERLVTKERFSQLGTGASYRYADPTILPSLSLGTEVVFGLLITEPESLGNVARELLGEMKVTYWPVDDHGPGERMTTKLSDASNLDDLIRALQASYDVVANRQREREQSTGLAPRGTSRGDE